MPRIPDKAQTEGSSTFDPDKFFDAWSKEEITPPYDNNFRRFIIRAFGLPVNDDYGYQATTEVSLLQAQTYIEFGAQGGLHAWYMDDERKEVSAVEAYHTFHNIREFLIECIALSDLSEISTTYCGRYSSLYGHFSAYDKYKQSFERPGIECKERLDTRRCSKASTDSLRTSVAWTQPHDKQE